MQIDFHHAVTYVLARWAGFSSQDAGVVAYASEYVDDTTTSGTVRFFNTGGAFVRFSSAHADMNLANLDDLKEAQVMIPFHFLPGLSGQDKAGVHLSRAAFEAGLMVTPHSPAAQDMAAECLKRKDYPYALHLLGITLHTFVDTWAHQGFVGRRADANDISLKELPGLALSPLSKLAPPIGHIKAGAYPDLPFLSGWSYKTKSGQMVSRDNLTDFTTAAHEAVKIMQQFLGASGTGLTPGQQDLLRGMFSSQTNPNGGARHQAWLKAIEENHFGFGKETLVYVPHGKGSWKSQALGDMLTVESGDEKQPFRPEFLESHWKLFHDALEFHRFSVLRDILPRYGLCLA
ncbi:MAG: hypothetical protein OEV94_03135 [Deltaproteobacteria bacterium]|nr:hypothetical protein [Deltaproteobacteria bacterium]